MIAFALLLCATQTATPSLTLAEAIAMALPRSVGLRAAEVDAELARLGSRRAQLERLRFRVDGQLAELWTKTNIGGGRGESSAGALGLSNVSANVEVPVFSGFRVESGIAAADAIERASLHDLEAERRLTALQVARAYWTVRKSGLLIEVEARALDRISAAEAIARSRLGAGLAPPSDVTRAEARRRLEAAVLADRRGQLAEAEAQLVVLLGASGPMRLIDPPRLSPFGERLPVLLANADAARPELQRGRARTEARAFGVERAEAGYYPTLAVSGLLQYGNNPFVAGAGARAVFGSANPFEGMAADVQLGAVLSLNIFDTLATKTAVDEARAIALAEVRALERDRQLVEGEVRSAYARLARHLGLTRELISAESIAEETVTLIGNRYRSGESSILELLEAELERTEIERRRVAGVADATLARLELEAALGRTLGVEP